MPSYTTSGNYATTNGTASAYRLDIEARTSAVTGGTLVEIWAQVTMTRNPGVPAFGPAGTRSWSLPGGRSGSVTGTPDASGNSTFSYNFANTNPQNVYNYFNRFVPYSQGASTTLTITVASGTSSLFFTSRTLSVNVPLFTLPTYSLSYNANSGSPTPASQSLLAGATFTVGAAPTRSGFTFVRWAGSDGNTYSPGSTATMPSSALTLSAVWAPPTPTGLAVGTRTQTSIQLSWNSTAGASGYNIFRNGTSVTSTTATSYTYQTLTAGTTYSLGVAAVSDTGGSSSTASINGSTLSSDPVYAADAAYPIAKIGLTYAGSVTATNATSYALAYGNLPPGLTLNTENGTISGRPEQRPDGSYFNDTAGTLDSFTFGITASGSSGSTPTTRQFVIRTVFPGEKLSTTPRDLIIARRWDGEAWVPVQRVRRFNGSSWIDISTT